MKKIMIIPLVIFIIAITSFPVSAITSNNDLYIDFYARGVQSGADTTFHSLSYVATGNLYNFRLEQYSMEALWSPEGEYYDSTLLSKPTLSSLQIQCAFLVAADIYLCFPFSVSSSNFGTLASYYDADSSFSSSQVANDIYTIQVGTSTYSDYPLDYISVSTLTGDVVTIGTQTWYFYKFNDVPAGSYVVDIPTSDMFYVDSTAYSSNWYIGFGFIGEQIPEDSGSGSSTPIGGGSGSGSGGSGDGNTYLDPWYSPDADLQTNITSITDTLDAAISSAGTVFEQIFYSVYASYQLEQIVFVSDQQNVQQTQVFNTSLSNVVSNFESGAVDYPTALDQMAVNYTTALQTAETPEQGNYITAVYQAKQQELFAKAVQDAGEKVKEVITDEDLKDLDDYTALEEDLLGKLDLQQLEDLITYQSWLNLLPVDEAMTYRIIFDFFVNDAVWKYWILIPFTFTIVSILLGTGVNMVGRSITFSRIATEREARKSARRK